MKSTWLTCAVFVSLLSVAAAAGPGDASPTSTPLHPGVVRGFNPQPDPPGSPFGPGGQRATIDNATSPTTGFGARAIGDQQDRAVADEHDKGPGFGIGGFADSERGPGTGRGHGAVADSEKGPIVGPRNGAVADEQD
ncbi:MAG: hypothetical protein HY319_02980 [Armatimonadetes bacterium]|nr:hypothetical protein [Armatimonadota bacterium]